MSVPKCKECEFHLIKAIYKQNNHWCKDVTTLGHPKFIFAKEAKTSPKWCPKRLLA
jgi:hypothetical protein